MTANVVDSSSGAARRVLLAVVLAAVWLGLNVAFPDLWPTGIPTAVTRLIIHGIILVGLWLGLSRTDFTGGTRVSLWLAIAVPFTLWLGLVWRLAVNGFFRPIPGVIQVTPPLPVAIFGPVLVGLLVLTRSKRIASLLDAMPVSWLIGLQLYRILGGIFLVNWAHGAIPGVFALPAGIGDTTVGLLALPAARWASSGSPAGRRVGMIWNLLGLTDLAVAIAMGFLSSPGPFQVFALDHPNVQVGTYPTVMIPAFGVPSSIILHGLSLWQLRRRARQTALHTQTDWKPDLRGSTI
jgi:hypothetical protein